ncbi:MAG: uroporphyrinogen decarboxylase family protein [Thermoplasmata archaeon]
MQRKVILRIARGEEQGNAVWFMRQAGRYLPDYDRIRSGRKFTDILRDPDTVYELSVLPLKYMRTDAIVVFTDILIPLNELGYSVSYENGIVVNKGETEQKSQYSGISRAIGRLSEEHSDRTIIGVLGGPFTTLSYIYDEGRHGYHITKKEVVEKGDEIMPRAIEGILDFASLQVKSGVDVLQVFDSWLGSLSEFFYERHVRRWEEYFMEKVKDLGKPVIFFSEGSSHLAAAFKSLHPDVFSVDWRLGLDRYRDELGDHVIQGNLDPNILATSDEYLRKEVARIMKQGRAFRGHIFNLGHGVPQWAEWRKLAMVADEVHSYE